MSSPQTPDLLVLFTALLALVFSPSLSAVLAPYVVIVVGGLLGTGWALKRRAPESRGSAWAFASLMLGTALVFTMPAAVYLQTYLPGSYQWLLAPLAAIIAAVGDDWPTFALWIWEQRGAIFRRNTEGSSK